MRDPETIATIAQQLIPSAADSQRYPAVEIMIATHAVRNPIRRGEDHRLHTPIGTGRAEGMISMEWRHSRTRSSDRASNP